MNQRLSPALTWTFWCRPSATYCTPRMPRIASASADVSVAADAEAGLAVAEPLARRRMIVLLHRVVFGMASSAEGRRVLDLGCQTARREGRSALRSATRGQALRASQRRRWLDGAAAEVVRRLHLVVAGGDDDEVHAGGADLILDGGFGAGADGDHRQHGGDADRHAEDRQRRLQPVAAQRPQSDRQCRTCSMASAARLRYVSSAGPSATAASSVGRARGATSFG